MTAYDELIKKVNAVQLMLFKMDYSTNVYETDKKMLDDGHNNKYITTQKFNRLTPESFAASLNK